MYALAMQKTQNSIYPLHFVAKWIAFLLVNNIYIMLCLKGYAEGAQPSEPIVGSRLFRMICNGDHVNKASLYQLNIF